MHNRSCWLLFLAANQISGILGFTTTNFGVVVDHQKCHVLSAKPDSESESNRANGDTDAKEFLKPPYYDPTWNVNLNRRQLFNYGSSLALASSLLAPKPAFSDAVIEQDVDCSNALTDLPPVPTDYCRLFFCRHGQTENNRLRLVQGSRVNIDINELGYQQGRRAGLALAQASPSSPSLIYYSPLRRAKETAEEANREGKLLSSNDNNFRELNTLMEVDFGPLAEGQLVKEAKPGMMATYARWSIGSVDYRPDGGGDSARDVR